jgi:hypothetical protein
VPQHPTPHGSSSRAYKDAQLTSPQPVTTTARTKSCPALHCITTASTAYAPVAPATQQTSYVSPHSGVADTTCLMSPRLGCCTCAMPAHSLCQRDPAQLPAPSALKQLACCLPRVCAPGSMDGQPY